MQSALVIIDVDIRSGEDEAAREELIERLRHHEPDAVVPLWVNLLWERGDLRLVCLAHDLSRLDDFLVDVVRRVPGVRSTSARLAFEGVIYPEALNEIPLQAAAWTQRSAAAVFVKSEPGRDRSIYQALLDLPPHPQVRVVWVLQLFHSPQADMKLLLTSDNFSALTGYVMSWVRTIPGILDTELVTMMDWQILGRPEDLIALTERFAVPGAGQPREVAGP